MTHGGEPICRSRGSGFPEAFRGGPRRRLAIAMQGVGFSFLALASGAGAQLPVGSQSCGFEIGGAVIVATVVDDSTRIPVGGSVVHLARCRGVADAAGRFVFRDVRPGELVFDAGHVDYAPFEGFRTTAGSRETVEVELRLRPGGPVQDCRAASACAALVVDAPLEGLDESERFQVLAVGTAIALGWQRLFPDREPYACTEALTPAVRRVLADRYRFTVDQSQCEIPTPGSDRVVRHAPSGGPAFVATARLVRELGPTQREMSLFILGGPRSGEGWLCWFERWPSSWQLTACQLNVKL